MEIPIYDNPPPLDHEPPERRTLSENIGIPSVKDRAFPAPTSFDDILGTSTSTSMNTTTHTSAVMDSIPSKRTRQRDLSGPMPVYRTRHLDEPFTMGSRGPGAMPRGPMTTNMNMNMSMSSGDLLGMRIPRPRPGGRPIPRPQMPDRAEGMNSIPRFRPLPGRHMYDGMGMGLPVPWNMTGMPTTHSMPDIGRGGPQPPQYRQYPIPTSQRLDAPPVEIVPNGTQKLEQRTEEKKVPHATSIVQSIPLEGAKDTMVSSSQRPSQEHGLYRKCSRCTNGFVQDQQRRTAGSASITGTAPSTTMKHLDCVEECEGEVASDARSIEVVKKEVVRPPALPGPTDQGDKSHTVAPPQDSATKLETQQNNECRQEAHLDDQIKATPARPSLGVRKISDYPVLVGPSDGKDHTACCPECCQESDCHGGCIGHPSPSPSPVKRMASTDTEYSSRSGSITSLEGQPLTPLSERGKKLGLVKSAFKKSFQRSMSPTKQPKEPVLSARINGAADIDMLPCELSSGPVSPSTFWGNGHGRSSSASAAIAAINLARTNSTGSGSTAASAAAKTAIGMTTSSESRKPAVLVKKQRSNGKNGAKIVEPLKVSADDGGKRKVTPNEGRKVDCSKDDNEDVATGEAEAKSRRLSGASIATLDIQVPKITSLSSGISAICEVAFVPFEASRMWLRNHPRVGSGGWSIMERAMEMLSVILGTMEACWKIAFVYSKTGKLRLPKIKRINDEDGEGKANMEMVTPAGFMWDCTRSGIYVLIFLAMAVLAVRIIRWVLGVVRVLGMIVRAVGWVSRVLLGGGILW